jgi:hypothetical protein
MDRPKIGFVTCVHPVYDLPEVLKHRDRAIAGLEKENCEIVADPSRLLTRWRSRPCSRRLRWTWCCLSPGVGGQESPGPAKS